MPIREELNINLISTLSNFIKHPFLILDSVGNILSSNKEAKRIFHLVEGTINIFDLFDETTSGEIANLIDEVENSGSYNEKAVSVTLPTGESFPVKINIRLFKTDTSNLTVCSFISGPGNITFNDTTILSFKINDIKKIIDDESIISILDKLNTSYPFTFIGKERFRSEINGLDEFFWLKNVESKYILVNEKIAKSLGITAVRIEGKSENKFIPSYLQGLYSSAENYMKETQNCVVLEGISLPGIAVSGNCKVIQVPLCDEDNNVIAFAGFTRTILAENEDSKLFKIAEQFLPTFPKPICFIDKNGIIRNTSAEFCKLIQGEFFDFLNNSYSEVFPDEIAEKIKYFINSPIEYEKFDISPKKYQDKYPDGFHIFLNRIMENEKESSGISILIEKNDDFTDLEKILTVRGRMFDLIIKNNPEPIYIYDTDNLRFLEVNDAALSLYDYRKDEFLQMDLTDLYTPEDIQTLLDTSNSKIGERQFSGPFRHKRKDGSSVYVEISKINFKFNDSDAHFNVVRDISAKLELEKDNQLFKAAFNNTEDFIFITDPEGFITYINKPVISLLGYSKDDLDKTSFASLVRNEERATVNTSVFQSHFKEVVSLTMELKKKTGEFLDVDLTATPVFDYKSDVDSFVIVGKIQKDGTVEKEVIEEVIKEVIVEKPVYASIPPTGQESVPSESSAFISSLFHEILTPINVILGFVQELTESIQNITPEQKESVDIISQNRSQLLNIMNSIAEYSSIQKNNSELKTESIAITDIIDELQNDFNEISSTRGIDFAYGRISSSLKFFSDRQKFKELSSLILKIAASITREKKIYFSSYQINESSFALSIKDNYSAASKNFIDVLDILFNKPENSATKDFGLSKLTIRLAKSLLSLLKGKLEILSPNSDKPDYAFVFPLAFENTMPVNQAFDEPVSENTIPEPGMVEQPVFVKEFTDASDVNEPIIKSEDNIIPEIKEEPVPEQENKGFIPDPLLNRIPEKEEEIVEESSLEEDIAEPEKLFKQMKSRFKDRLELSSLSCLYIEDQVDSQILFKVQMKELRSIKFAVSFEEALPFLDEGDFDFIVMDINLQGEYNGLDALKIIHKMPEYEHIPIIAVTAYVLPGDKEKFIATGFNDFISKPIFREKMIDSLEKIFMMDM
jgi:PAS domain S-box-containing protein